MRLRHKLGGPMVMSVPGYRCTIRNRVTGRNQDVLSLHPSEAKEKPKGGFQASQE